MTAKRRTEGITYRVINPLLSVRRSADRRAPEYHEFIEWPAGSLITEYPPHTAITEWLSLGYIVEVEP